VRADDIDPDFRKAWADTKIYHFHTHINGAAEELTTGAGQVAWRARYESRGNLALEDTDADLITTKRNDHTAQPIRMQGQYEDTETGLYYNTFRYYDPDIGRFITEDPIGLAGGENLYRFAANADRWIDPWGLKPCFATSDAQARAEKVIFRHGRVETAEGHYKMPNRRAARQAASAIAGNLDSEPKIIIKSEYKGGAKTWKDSSDKIGVQSADKKAGWRDDNLGHSRFDAEPHVNVWDERNGINPNLHLDY
jgi:RHS repeat-associated protein